MKKALSLMVILCLLAVVFPGVIIAEAFSGEGAGTDESPFIIKTTAQFLEINERPSAVYRLEAEEPIKLDNSFTTFSNSFTGKLIGVDGKNVIALDINRTGTTEYATIFKQIWKVQ